MSGHSHDPSPHDAHSHGHSHSHGHHDDDFDWVQWADQLELEALTLMPLIDTIVEHHTANVDWSTAQHVLDLGCGPGVISCALAQHAPHAQVTALDSSPELLARVRHRAAAQRLATRVHTLEADMEAAMPPLRPMDVVWAGMVLHHVADRPAVLSSVLRLLQPGGTLVMIEFAGPPEALPADDPLTEAWQRMESGVVASRNGRLGVDPNTIDWPTLLAEAGFEAITDITLSAEHEAPIGATERRWVQRHIVRSIEWLDGTMQPDDVDALTALADTVPSRDDLVLRHERRVLTARRPLS